MKVKKLIDQSCLTLCNPMDYSPPRNSVHGILQVRILEWVAIPSSRGIFPTQGLNLGLLYYRQILYRLSHQGSPMYQFSSVQFSSVQSLSCDRLCDSMNRSMPGLPVHHHLPEFTQTHGHRVSDAIQSSHPGSSPSPSAPNPSQHQSLFQ